MISTGAWRPTATPLDTGARGFHLPAMISTIGDVSLTRLVQKWLSAHASGPAALMSFITTTLAEPWEDQGGGRIQPHALVARLEDYGDEDVAAPNEVLFLSAGVDVQVDRLEVVVVGWGRGSESWIVDAHQIPGEPSRPEVQAALLTSLDDVYRRADGTQLAIHAVAIDAGYLPDRVAYPLAQRRPGRIYAIKGIGGRFGEPSILKFDARKPPILVNVDALKLEVHLGLEMAAPGPGFLHLTRRICDEEFLAQLTAEHRETKRKSGVATMTWVEDRVANHALDCTVYARAALRIFAATSGHRTEDRLLAKLAAREKAA